VLKNLLALLVVLLLGAAAAGAYWKLVAQPEAQATTGGHVAARGPVAIEAAEVKVAPVEQTTEAVGTLISNESVVLKPEVTGRVVDIRFDEGQPVKAGQVLVDLDASVEKAQLVQAEAQVALATAELERAQELRRNSVGTQRALDEAQAQQRTAAAAVDLAKAHLAKLTLTAPFDGIAGLRKVSVGDLVMPGAEIVNLEQIQPLKVDFRVPERFLSALFGKNGEAQRIEVGVDAFPDERFEGQVYALNPLLNEQGRAIVIRARIDNPTATATGLPRLRPGLFARVTLTLNQQAEALWVPEEALVPQGSQQVVYKLAPGEQPDQLVARLTPVRLGARHPGEVQIVDGLARGDRVVTAGTLKLRDGAPVQVQSPVPTASGPAPAPAQG
jgi:membrane fusion protein (multidrug efflux system)